MEVELGLAVVICGGQCWTVVVSGQGWSVLDSGCQWWEVVLSGGS